MPGADVPLGCSATGVMLGQLVSCAGRGSSAQAGILAYVSYIKASDQLVLVVDCAKHSQHRQLQQHPAVALLCSQRAR